MVVVGGSYDVYMYKQLCLLHCMIKKESKTKNKTKTSNEWKFDVNRYCKTFLLVTIIIAHSTKKSNNNKNSSSLALAPFQTSQSRK